MKIEKSLETFSKIKYTCSKSLFTAYSIDEALSIAKTIQYPVLVRPSYVLGGRGMEIVYDDDDLKTYVAKACTCFW